MCAACFVKTGVLNSSLFCFLLCCLTLNGGLFPSSSLVLFLILFLMVFACCSSGLIFVKLRQGSGKEGQGMARDGP